MERNRCVLVVTNRFDSFFLLVKILKCNYHNAGFKKNKISWLLLPTGNKISKTVMKVR